MYPLFQAVYKGGLSGGQIYILFPEYMNVSTLINNNTSDLESRRIASGDLIADRPGNRANDSNTTQVVRGVREAGAKTGSRRLRSYIQFSATPAVGVYESAR